MHLRCLFSVLFPKRYYNIYLVVTFYKQPEISSLGNRCITLAYIAKGIRFISTVVTTGVRMVITNKSRLIFNLPSIRNNKHMKTRKYKIKAVSNLKL
ncbi:unnamed protein product, partial [Dicrocoelium dendriticum]